MVETDASTCPGLTAFYIGILARAVDRTPKQLTVTVTGYNARCGESCDYFLNQNIMPNNNLSTLK